MKWHILFLTPRPLLCVACNGLAGGEELLGLVTKNSWLWANDTLYIVCPHSTPEFFFLIRPKLLESNVPLSYRLVFIGTCIHLRIDWRLTIPFCRIRDILFWMCSRVFLRAPLGGQHCHTIIRYLLGHSILVFGQFFVLIVTISWLISPFFLCNGYSHNLL